jgi:F0F1-type ATP synthase beta subunit
LKQFITVSLLTIQDVFVSSDDIASKAETASLNDLTIELYIVYKYYASGHYPSSGPQTGTSSIDWTQLSRSYLKMETESSLRNVLF